MSMMRTRFNPNRAFIHALATGGDPISAAACTIFAKQKARNGEQETHGGLTKHPIKELTMEYLVLVAVVSMMALYALIIVGCLKQPEW